MRENWLNLGSVFLVLNISYINPYLSFSMPEIVWNGAAHTPNFASFKQLFTH